MSVELITRNGGILTPTAEGVVNKISNVNGIINGCTITFSGNTLSIAAGWMLVEGRVIHFESSESIQASQTGKLAVKINLAAAPYASLVVYPTSTVLTQDDINGGGSVYEQQLGTFTYSSGAVTAFTQTIGDARTNLAGNKARSRSDLGIYIQQAEPSSPAVGDLWLY